MTSDRKKPTAGFWITVALVAVLVGYPLSFGPACWILTHQKLLSKTRNAVEAPYVPLFQLLRDGPSWARVPLGWYVSLWT